MYLSVLRTEGLPKDGGVLSLRVGATRRQGPLPCAERFRICSLPVFVQIDILKHIGRSPADALELLQEGALGPNAECKVALKSADGRPMSLTLRAVPATATATPLAPEATAEAAALVEAGGAAAAALGDLEKELCSAFLTSCGLQGFLQEQFQRIMAELPEDPYAYLAARFREAAVAEAAAACLGQRWLPPEAAEPAPEAPPDMPPEEAKLLLEPPPELHARQLSQEHLPELPSKRSLEPPPELPVRSLSVTVQLEEPVEEAASSLEMPPPLPQDLRPTGFSSHYVCEGASAKAIVVASSPSADERFSARQWGLSAPAHGVDEHSDAPPKAGREELAGACVEEGAAEASREEDEPDAEVGPAPQVADELMRCEKTCVRFQGEEQARAEVCHAARHVDSFERDGLGMVGVAAQKHFLTEARLTLEDLDLSEAERTRREARRARTEEVLQFEENRRKEAEARREDEEEAGMRRRENALQTDRLQQIEHLRRCEDMLKAEILTQAQRLRGAEELEATKADRARIKASPPASWAATVTPAPSQCPAAAPSPKGPMRLERPSLQEFAPFVLHEAASSPGYAGANSLLRSPKAPAQNVGYWGSPMASAQGSHTLLPCQPLEPEKQWSHSCRNEDMMAPIVAHPLTARAGVTDFWVSPMPSPTGGCAPRQLLPDQPHASSLCAPGSFGAHAIGSGCGGGIGRDNDLASIAIGLSHLWLGPSSSLPKPPARLPATACEQFGSSSPSGAGVRKVAITGPTLYQAGLPGPADLPGPAGVPGAGLSGLPGCFRETDRLQPQPRQMHASVSVSSGSSARNDVGAHGALNASLDLRHLGLSGPSGSQENYGVASASPGLRPVGFSGPLGSPEAGLPRLSWPVAQSMQLALAVSGIPISLASSGASEPSFCGLAHAGPGLRFARLPCSASPLLDAASYRGSALAGPVLRSAGVPVASSTSPLLEPAAGSGSGSRPGSRGWSRPGRLSQPQLLPITAGGASGSSASSGLSGSGWPGVEPLAPLGRAPLPLRNAGREQRELPEFVPFAQPRLAQLDRGLRQGEAFPSDNDLKHFVPEIPCGSARPSPPPGHLARPPAGPLARPPRPQAPMSPRLARYQSYCPGSFRAPAAQILRPTPRPPSPGLSRFVPNVR